MNLSNNSRAITRHTIIGLAGMAALFAAMSLWGATNESKVYGKLFMDLQSVDDGESSYFRIQSNASRLGLNGTITPDNYVKGDTRIGYQLEYEVDPDGDGTEFKQRNSFLGLDGSWGKTYIGKYDTALKRVQAKVDVFSDTSIDIKQALEGENRENNVIGYETPRLGGAKVTLVGILTEDSNADGFSTSLTWQPSKSFYVGYGVDKDVDDHNLTRVAILWKPTGGLAIGALSQSGEETTGDKNDHSGLVFSVKYSWGQSAVRIMTASATTGGGTVTSGDNPPAVTRIGDTDESLFGIGYDYMIGKQRLYMFYGTDETDAPGADNDTEFTYIAFGSELKF